MKDATFGRAKVIKQGCRYFIALAKTRVSILLEEKILKEALRSLYITLKLNLQIISVSKTDVNNVSWTTIDKFLRELFYNSSTKVIVCDNCATIFETSDRIKIIVKNHLSTIGSHKDNKQRLTKEYVIIISGQL